VRLAGSRSDRHVDSCARRSIRSLHGSFRECMDGDADYLGGSAYEVTQPIGEYIADDKTFSTTVHASNMARGGPHLR
jgi:hypothetical protein